MSRLAVDTQTDGVFGVGDRAGRKVWQLTRNGTTAVTASVQDINTNRPSYLFTVDGFTNNADVLFADNFDYLLFFEQRHGFTLVPKNQSIAWRESGLPAPEPIAARRSVQWSLSCGIQSAALLQCTSVCLLWLRSVC